MLWIVRPYMQRYIMLGLFRGLVPGFVIDDLMCWIYPYSVRCHRNCMSKLLMPACLLALYSRIIMNLPILTTFNCFTYLVQPIIANDRLFYATITNSCSAMQKVDIFKKLNRQHLIRKLLGSLIKLL